jgi:von Willebrand factor type A domain-containing protein
MNPIQAAGPASRPLSVAKSALVGVVISLGMHVVLLVALSFIVFKSPLDQLQMIVDSVFTEERMQEEFTQEVEQSTAAAETVNYIAGSQAAGVTGTGGVAGPIVAQQKLDDAQSLKEPDVKVNVGAMTVPGLNIISKDLGTGQVSGETGRVVEGYGAALGQMSQELVRMMRESKVLVVWLFDESDSMKDDQKEIRERFHKVYEELGLVQKQDAKLKASDDILLTSIMSFGKGIEEHTVSMKPTSNTDEIKKAIDKIKVDESGLENTCAAITAAVSKYQQFAVRSKRKLVVVVVSDESGDDGNLIEETIHRCKTADAPVYVLGHYSIFGYPYATTKWVDPKTGLVYYPRINRGPETPFPECLQFDGLHERWDAFSSGFGPYEQVRLAKQTGGIFFILPGNEDNLLGAGSYEQRKFDLLDMKEYLPDLSSRMEYAKERDSHKFRETQWKVIVALNPHLDDKLKMREHWYQIDHAEFAKEGEETAKRAMRAMGLLNEAVKQLDSVHKLRDKEQSERWRANYDLMHAQCMAYRVRLFQLLLALDQHYKAKPMPKDPKSNRWNIVRVPQLLEPTKEQIKQTKVDLEELNRQDAMAKAEYMAVVENHPRTPYARRAQWELQNGFGMKFAEDFRDPRYDTVTDVKVPKQ